MRVPHPCGFKGAGFVPNHRNTRALHEKTAKSAARKIQTSDFGFSPCANLEARVSPKPQRFGQLSYPDIKTILVARR
jgi:hypothetical protein